MLANDTGKKDNQKERGQGFPQTLHDRSREAGTELQRLLISLATGSLAAYFLALTASDSDLTLWQQIAALSGVLFMGISVLSGVLSWHADSRRNYFWASALQAEESKTRTALYRSRDRWLTKSRFFFSLLSRTFSVGVVSSLVYMALRVLSW